MATSKFVCTWLYKPWIFHSPPAPPKKNMKQSVFFAAAADWRNTFRLEHCPKKEKGKKNDSSTSEI